MRPGRAVQVDPVKSALKGAGTKRLKLKYYKLLSNFPFRFNLRRFTPELLRLKLFPDAKVGPCRLTL